MNKIVNFFRKVPITIWGAIIGILSFVFLYGIDVLNIYHTDWLIGNLDKNDRGLPYLGTLFYVFSDWQFPVIGLSDQLAFPNDFSLLYVDNVPIAAIICKMFKDLIGRIDFQYLGIVSFVNHILMCSISSKLISQITKSKLVGVVSSFFFIINYPYLNRIFVHFGLHAQWLLIIVLFFFVSNLDTPLKVKQKISFYALIGCLTILIHSYFLPPILISIVFYEMGCIKKKKDWIVYFGYIGTYLVTCLFTFWIIGGTHGTTAYASAGFGEQSSNLNTLINAHGSRIFNALPLYTSAQHNGNIYLGAGLFLLISLVTVAGIVKYKSKLLSEIWSNLKKYWNIYLGMCAIFLFALSPKVTFNEKVVFEIPFPKMITDLWGIFRATGRASWMIMYIIIIFFIFKLFKLYRYNIAFALLLGCLCLQFFDFSPEIEKSINNANDPYESILNEEAWEQLAKLEKDKLIFLNGANRNNSIKLTNIIGTKRVYEISRFAFNNNLKMNDFYFIRTDSDIGAYRGEIWEQLYNNIVDDKAIYIFVETPFKLIQNNTLNFYQIDGFLVGISEELQGYSKITADNELSIKTLLGTMLSEGYYLDGERVLYPNGISRGPEIPLDMGSYILTVSGNGLNCDDLQIKAGEFCEVISMSGENELITVNFILNDDVENVSVWVSNSSDENIVIKDMLLREVH